MAIERSFPPQSASVSAGEGNVLTAEAGGGLRNGLILMAALALGLLLAIVWSFELADRVIGAGIANTALGTDAASVELSAGGMGLGLIFALVAGLAATFTACNCVVFGCVVPLMQAKQAQAVSLRALIGLMGLGVLAVTALYGTVGAVAGEAVPALSDTGLAIGTAEYPQRLAQSTVVFTAVGVLLAWWGTSMLGLVASPFARLIGRYPWLRPFGLGLLIGLFTVGRPYPLFRKLFEYAAEVGNPLFGATAMMLQGLGNILLAVALVLVLLWGTGGRFERWMRVHPQTITALAAASLIAGGAFFVFYWGLRVPSYFGIGWFPHMPYR